MHLLMLCWHLEGNSVCSHPVLPGEPPAPYGSASSGPRQSPSKDFTKMQFKLFGSYNHSFAKSQALLLAIWGIWVGLCFWCGLVAGGSIVHSKPMCVLERDLVKCLSGKPHLVATIASEYALCSSFLSRLMVLRTPFVEK